ncbi:hypothetical protein [Streptomyces gibsoniae]|uniref:Uncharacterized protein n=1 Tax=Streptomyces gibsoniae TaxID=3075529 RepID=A0ABU2TUL0_9ACTN|nr:hypothetical protein [Streptomyces sp. DSM 41699]MDT0464647.1 hypothetical protein [Streptomyces sp. DSM 41699]
MSVADELIEQVRAWISLEGRRSPELEAASNIEVSPGGHHPRSLSWILEGSDFMAQAVLWESGEFEVDFAEVATGQVRTQSGRAADFRDLESVLEAARDWVMRSPLSSR